ncbi:cholesterol 24-hydroxylase-like [Stylophora pistillata]|uniref:cholesterol 24-hydroxylase-like n=1 Tax=Stylophora pistillata TaxID=50429 RepID=UPI000C03FC4E|nr:cholesterol 24-hydroxylase-like [Stylophora pistillata]
MATIGTVFFWSAISIAALLAILFSVFSIYMIYLHWKFSHLPGPNRDSFFSGNLPHIKRELAKGHIFPELVIELNRIHGPIILLWIFHKPITFVSDPELIRKCLITLNLPKNPFGYINLGYPTAAPLNLTNRSVIEAGKFVRDFGRKVILERQEAMLRGEDTPPDIHAHILGVKAKEPSITMEDMVDEFFTFFIAGGQNRKTENPNGPLLQQFELSLCPGQDEIRYVENLTLRPKGGLLCTLKRRRQKEMDPLKVKNVSLFEKETALNEREKLREKLEGVGQLLIDGNSKLKSSVKGSDRVGISAAEIMI